MEVSFNENKALYFEDSIIYFRENIAFQTEQ